MSKKYITGFHAIEERVLSFDSGKNNQKLTVHYSKAGPRIKKIIEAANKAGIKVIQTQENILDQYVQELSKPLQEHRGIVMEIEGKIQSSSNLVNFDEWVKNLSAASDSKPVTVVVLDRVTDPHNVGAIIRSCDQFGVDLVIMPEHKSANDIEDNDIIMRSSAGSSAWVPVAIVNNLVRSVEALKDVGFWAYGADAGGENCSTIKFPDRRIIVMGSEGSGIASLLKKQCDQIVSIPTCGKIDSLNVSVAAGVLLYELYRRQN